MNADHTRRSLLQTSLIAGTRTGHRRSGMESETWSHRYRRLDAGPRCYSPGALLVYEECIPRLRQNASSLAPGALHRTAQLFRSFGEDYHERRLEEQHIFPVLRKMNHPLARNADILIAQHRRGRGMIDYILAVTGGAKIAATHTTPLAPGM